MPRYKLVLEYDGGPYNGFQAQEPSQPTIQASLERAITAFSGESVRVTTAGRTDTGVHATAQVVHLDLSKDWKPQTVADALNAHLVPEPIAILSAMRAADDFSARFDATARTYLYRILNRRSPPALLQGKVWPIRKPLDEAAMHAAAQILIGLHDFTTFRDVQCQAKSPVKTLDAVRVWREGEEVRLEFSARSFLHRQVRSMTGSIVEVGAGRWTAADLKAALDANDRKECGPVAPADGLYLVEVRYK